MQLDWFNRTLRGYKGGASLPPVRIFVMGGGDGCKTVDGKLNHGGRWRDEQEWPPARAQFTPYYLRSGHVFSFEPPGVDDAPQTYRYDPLNPVPTIGGTSYFLCGADPATGRRRMFVPYGPQDQRERL